MISTLPKGNNWGLSGHLYQYQGFWLTLPFLQRVMLVQQQFQAQPTDIMLCSAPRTGKAWLKSLTFATITRTSYDDSTTPLLFKMPHVVVPFMELFKMPIFPLIDIVEFLSWPLMLLILSYPHQ
ncbi:hypothetical protein Gotur_034632 [Gossypium turneri]